MAPTPGIAVELAGIGKRFGGVQALQDVSFAIRTHEIHALLGENGAGKSTILKILRGVLAPDTGTIRIGADSYTRLNPQLGRNKGIAMIFQEMSLVPTLSVAQNIFLTQEPLSRLGLIDDRAMRQRAAGIFDAMGVSIDPGALVGYLSTGQQQLTEIAKALSQNANLLVLDEPTSALTATEVGILFDLLRRLRAEAIGWVFQSNNLISHLTAEANVAVPLLFRGVPRRDAGVAARRALDQLGVGHRADSLPRHLSGGEAQRVAIARALVAEPAVILADEPTGNLDPDSAEGVMAAFADAVRTRGTPVVVVTHDVTLAARHATRIFRCERGMLTPDADPKSLVPKAPAANAAVPPPPRTNATLVPLRAPGGRKN